MKKKILIVVDDKKISTALAVRLRATGYEVAMAYDAVLAFSTAVKHQPDLVVLDISMPGGDGFAVAETGGMWAATRESRAMKGCSTDQS